MSSQMSYDPRSFKSLKKSGLQRDLDEVLTFSGFIRYCINCVHNCEDHSSFDFTSAVLYLKHFIYHFTVMSSVKHKNSTRLLSESTIKGIRDLLLWRTSSLSLAGTSCLRWKFRHVKFMYNSKCGQVIIVIRVTWEILKHALALGGRVWEACEACGKTRSLNYP